MLDPEEISIKRPVRVSAPKTFEQLGILVLDGSGSMNEQTAQHISKADAVTQAVNDLFSRCKASRNRNNFNFAIVNYDHRSVVKMQPTPVKDVDDHGDYNPMDGLGGATYISKGLEDAEKMAKDFLSQSQEGGMARSVVIVIMTDGVDMTESETTSVANRLKKMKDVSVSGCFFETLGADSNDMQKCADYVKTLCTDETKFSMVSDADALRNFFVASMSNMAGML
ncbi:VWA domain-containing protein [Porphyromonas gingivalis]|uniref:vWA domain-containing protein n=1 Tax=Porphyromonas gingivalis TaxID=837 RepID=UPI00265A6CA7|nr:vWA domain-containing protein [Porphyromonas gingivalis]MDP0530678.1 VWA domain-containing protein [Porphyromonas gingivalis]MDP0625636.1 VWA domain-containing protein [Porphyromonas gingivalis]WKD51741.1 VWA domain-containing protein [Porphyromonas gingivalis]WKD53789.1 VWA domain-containing protein [Porphyromonas gingivalis]